MELRMKRIICTAADWENIRERKKLGGRIERAATELDSHWEN